MPDPEDLEEQATTETGAEEEDEASAVAEEETPAPSGSPNQIVRAAVGGSQPAAESTALKPNDLVRQAIYGVPIEPALPAEPEDEEEEPDK